MSETQWVAAELDCDICGHEYHAVYPTCAERLECPGCGHMNPNPDWDPEAEPTGESDGE